MVRSQGAKPGSSDGPAPAEALTIGELAAAGGVGVETIRFYQRRDLLRTPAKGAGIRHYGRDDLRRLRFIRHAGTAGFTLEEIRELLGLDAGEDRGRARELANARIAAISARIAGLRRSRHALRRLARECAEGSTGRCPILGSFDF